MKAKFSPKFLSVQQKDYHVSVCTELITGDESWMYDYDPETKIQSSQRKTSYSTRHSKSNITFLMVVLMVLSEIVLNYKYKVLLQRLKKDARKIRHGVLLHHNASTILSNPPSFWPKKV